MLVIISDLHLTDGTSGTTIDPDAFNIFRERLRDLAWAASDRRVDHNQVYEPIDKIQLLLLGDILDVIRSSVWLQSDIRPWDDPTTRAFIKKVEDITKAILANNQQALAVVRDLGRSGLEIPARDLQTEPTVRVPVFIYYMVGNHDWFFHVPGPAYDNIRASVIEALGLSNDPSAVFPHDPAESPDIQQLCADHHVFARHGDIYDSINYEGPDRNRSSLGDAIVIELVDRFADEARRELSGRVPDSCLLGLREIDNVRPFDLIPVWVDGLVRRTCEPNEAKLVREVWNRVADHFLGIPFVKHRHSSLKWGLRLSEGMSFADLGKIIPWAKNLLASLGNVSPLLNKIVSKIGLSDNFYANAFGEKAFTDAHISYIVNGHTHRFEVVPLRAAHSTTDVADATIYVNSGTWRAVYDLAKYRPQLEEFFGYHVMTYLAFFRGDERKGKAFETWSGSLEAPMLESQSGYTGSMADRRPA